MSRTRLILCLVSLLLFITLAQGQTPNVAIETNAYDQSETAVAQDPLTTTTLLSTWNDVRNTYSQPGYAFSTDAGNSWQNGILTPKSPYVYGFDPSTGFNRSGRAFYCYVARVYRPPTDTLNTIFVSYTTDNGANWSHSQVSQDTIAQDKPYMAIDNTTGTYSGRLYASWTDLKGWRSTSTSRIKFSYSTDNGASWTTPTTLATKTGTGSMSIEAVAQAPSTLLSRWTGPGFVQGSVPTVGPDGEVYVAYMEMDSLREDRDWSTGTIHVLKSTNGGGDFSEVLGQATNVIWNRRLGKLRGSSDPTIAVDPSSGYVYLAYNAWDSDAVIDFQRSTNGGDNWSSPSVATASTTDEQIFPWLCVSSTGVISLVYYQGTSSAVDVYVAQSTNSGQSFASPNTKVNSAGMNPGNATWTLDYQGITARTSADPLPVWTDFRNSNADIYAGLFGAPAAPTGVSVSGTTGQHPTVSWSANSESDLSGYKLYRKVDPDESVFSLIATLNTSQRSYTDGECVVRTGTGGQWAVYKVKAYDATGNLSDFSSQVSKPVNWYPRKVGVALSALPEEFELSAGYPNPFNPTTSIRFALPTDAHVKIVIYDALGREVARLADGLVEAGFYTFTWNAQAVASGVYFARLDVTDGAGRNIFNKLDKLVLSR